MNETIYEGLTQAKSALQVLKGVFANERTIYYSQCAFIADMSMLYKNDRKLEQPTHLLENNDELIKTLQVYLSCNLNANETARQLIIHRNTLNYRLNRIYKMTGKNPHHIMELVELNFMLIHRVK
ncbi:Carbohydrate diacid regulator [compost metagenome]